jgi:tRNA (cytidine/uridine-2'-O-)-methyltransferase
VEYKPGDFLLFGRESAGIPTAIREEYAATWVSIPMLNTAARSLNLSNCVALVLYEALRQNNFGSQATGLSLTN